MIEDIVRPTLPVDATENWREWHPDGDGRFLDLLGVIRTKCLSTDSACVRFTPEPMHANRGGLAHGGYLMSCVDEALFHSAAALELTAAKGSGVTVSANVNFIGAASVDAPIDAITRIVGETGRMFFISGHMEQEGRRIASFEGILRKLKNAGVN